MNRREFLTQTGFLLTAAEMAAAATFPIIDTHVHFYDPSRPQGVPWPPKDDKVLYRRVLPEEFRQLTAPLGVTAAIEIEASPWIADNQWVLDLADKNPIIAGTIGHLDPEKPEFAKQLDHFHRDRRFRGIRCGNLWNQDLGQRASNPVFIAGLKLLAQADLALDTANPDAALIAAVVRVTDAVPDLRVVIDHLPVDPPPDQDASRQLRTSLKELQNRPQVYIKVSNVPRRVNGRVEEDPAYYRPALDALWNQFGPDRLLYGSNWPVSELVAPYSVAFKIVRDYFESKGATAAEKYFYGNALAAYKVTLPKSVS